MWSSPTPVSPRPSYHQKKCRMVPFLSYYELLFFGDSKTVLRRHRRAWCFSLETSCDQKREDDPFSNLLGTIIFYYFPMRAPGFSSGRHEADDRPATMWYHDHFLDFTGPNVYKGLAGFFLVFDELDTGDETGTLFPGTNLRLPSSAFDVPLVIQDKSCDAQGHLLFDTFEHDGFLGNQFVVNGKIQPYFEVQRRKYHFRLLNGSNAGVYQLFLSQAPNSKTVFPCDQIATEGGLLSAPIRNITNF